METIKKLIKFLQDVAKDDRIPERDKVVLAGLLVLLVSPIDLIPDFIPVLGYLDDLIITPGGIWLAVRLIPPEVLEEARATSATQKPDRRIGVAGAAIILLIWILAIIWGATIILRMVESP